jgi:hypothetical protein
VLRRLGLRLAVAAVLSVPGASLGHHSRAHYAPEMYEIEGELVEINWRNPHASFALAVTTDSGEREVWQIESWSSPYVMTRMGIGRDLFKVGDRVTIAGRRSSLDPKDLLAVNILFSDGHEAVLAASAEPYWSGEHVGGVEQWRYEATNPDAVAAADAGLFRVWSIDHIYAEKLDFSFTEQALAARADWNDLDNFMLRCEPAGMPYAMRMPFPFEFFDNGSEITLRVEYMDVVRTIHMVDGDVPADFVPSRLGYSVGHWVGDTLVVETTHIDFPYFDDLGTPQSGAIEIREEFTLSDDRSGLRYVMTIVDPATFTAPATIEMGRLDLGESVAPFGCRPG